MRTPHVIDKNTLIEYSPSDDSKKLVKESERNIFPENLEWGNEDCPSLVTYCVRAIADKFADKPLLEELPCAERDHLLEILPTDLPLEIVIPLIDYEIYWQRRYADKFGRVKERLYPDWTWKGLFIERYVQETVEQAQPQYCDEENMEGLTKLACPYVHRLLISQLQAWKPPLTWGKDEIPEFYPIDHINLSPILKNLPNIEELDIIYGMNNVSDEFNWNMFKFSVDDCRKLGNAILTLNNLKIMKLHRSQLEDKHCQALMQGLIQNGTLIELDLSHCQIGDQGALCIAKLMTVHPTLEILKLCDNKIRTLGGEGIGFALLEESCCPLIHVDLRLNPLEHDGTMGILRALVRGNKPKELSLAACIFGDDTPTRVGQMLNLNRSLEVLDVSSNWLGEEGGEAIIVGLANNRVIQWLDLRETDIPNNYLLVIEKLLRRNRLGKDEEEEQERLDEEGSDNTEEVVIDIQERTSHDENRENQENAQNQENEEEKQEEVKEEETNKND